MNGEVHEQNNERRPEVHEEPAEKRCVMNVLGKSEWIGMLWRCA